MGRYVLRRLLQFVPVFLGTTFLIYTLVWAVPGDPFAGKCGDRACPDSFVQVMTARYGLDQPLLVQYFGYLGKLFTGNFGETFNGNSIGEQIGNAYPLEQQLTMEVKGRDMVAGIPKTVVVNSDEIREALTEPTNAIVEAVLLALERTPPELAADIVDKGIVLAGGGALLKNLDVLLREETGLPVMVCDDPISAVVLGSGKTLDHLELLKEVTIG